MSDLTASQAPASSPATAGAASNSSSKRERLKLSVIWNYTLSRVAFSLMGVMFGVYLMKNATDVLLIAPAIMGTLIAASRLWDGFTDPLVGYLSDRVQSRFGRRRVWLYASALPMAMGLVMIWAPPGDLTGFWLVVWMAVALLVYETASTAYLIPHGALGMQLTPDYHQRTRLFGYAHMIGFIGSVLGLWHAAVHDHGRRQARLDRCFAAVHHSLCRFLSACYTWRDVLGVDLFYRFSGWLRLSGATGHTG
ncbi:MAG: MFS transporter [Proteobacteria bacterium]|nr:MFS transporter [Pseudomonadota bacterium]